MVVGRMLVFSGMVEKTRFSRIFAIEKRLKTRAVVS